MNQPLSVEVNPFEPANQAAGQSTRRPITHTLTSPFSIRNALRHHVTRFNGALGLFVVVLLLFECVVARLVQVDGLMQLLHIWPGLLAIFAALFVCHWRPLPRFIDSCENAIWAILLTDMLSVLIQLAGRSPYPLVDDQLSALDRVFHTTTFFFVQLASHVPAMQVLLTIVYNLVPLLVVTALLLPPFVGRPSASRRFIVSLLLAAVITAAMFAFWPAAGPWVTEGFKPSGPQAQVTRYLGQLKSASHVTLDFESAAIVSFPSFHVVLAILSAVALSGIRKVRIMAWAIAGLACLSTLTTGWHYAVDIAGGLAVAGMALLLAEAVMKFLARPLGHNSVDAFEENAENSLKPAAI